MTKASFLDFETLDTEAASEQPFELELLHPATKKPLGVFISIVGAESGEIKADVRKEINRDRIKEFQAARNKQGVEPETIEEQEADSVRLASKLAKGWRTVTDGKSEPVVIWKGEKLDFSSDNLTRWLLQFSWARVQILDASRDLGNFLKN